MFFEKFSFILQINGCTKERRNRDGEHFLYGYIVMLINDLMVKETQDLHNDLASGNLTYMPPILSIEIIRL